MVSFSTVLTSSLRLSSGSVSGEVGEGSSVVGMGERSGSKCLLWDLTPSTARGGSDQKAEDRAFSPDSQNWADLSLSLLALFPGVPLVPLNHDISSLTPKVIGKPREK